MASGFWLPSRDAKKYAQKLASLAKATDKASAPIANFHGAKVWGIFQADSHIFPKYSHIFPNIYIYQLIFNKTVVFLQRNQK